MADSSDDLFHQEEKPKNELEELKKNLEGWREVLIPLSKVMYWEKPYHPAIIVGVVTFVFAMIWYFEPSVLTIFSLVGFVACLIDFLVPIIGPTVLSGEKWTVVQEKQYEEICEHVMHFRNYLVNSKDAMVYLKTTKPKVYFCLVLGVLAIVAWLGSVLDNLFLTYFLVTVTLLFPGMRQHEIIKKYLNAAAAVFRTVVFGKAKQN